MHPLYPQQGVWSPSLGLTIVDEISAPFVQSQALYSALTHAMDHLPNLAWTLYHEQSGTNQRTLTIHLHLDPSHCKILVCTQTRAQQLHDLNHKQ